MSHVHLALLSFRRLASQKTEPEEKALERLVRVARSREGLRLRPRAKTLNPKQFRMTFSWFGRVSWSQEFGVSGLGELQGPSALSPQRKAVSTKAVEA